MLVAMPPYGQVIEVNDALIKTHGIDKCAGKGCAIHSPSKHHMLEWRMVLRLDKEGIIERTCPHGVGHPDPDSEAYFKNIGKWELGIHGCDGCCSPEEETDDEVV